MHVYILETGNNTTSLLNNAAVGAFLGSFSAFIFGLIAYDYTKKRERWVTHHNAIVKAEQLMNRHLNQITGNVFLLKGAVDTYKKSSFSENVLDSLENPDLTLEFHNIELINTYLDYQSLVEKVNHDLEAWNKSNDRLFTAALSGKVSPADIAINRKQLSERTEQIISHLEDLLQETYTTGAYMRVFLSVDKRDFFARLEKTSAIKTSAKQIAEERKKYVKESEETMRKDREGRLKKYS